MKIKIVVLCLLCICCFETQSQSNMGCGELKNKVANAFKENKGMRIEHGSSSTQSTFKYEKDSKSNTHLIAIPNYSKKERYVIIDIAGKTYFNEIDKDWSLDKPVNFKYDAWLDSCLNIIKILDGMTNCVFKKNTKITGTPYSVFISVIEKDTFEIWVNKKTNRIGLIEGDIQNKDIHYSCVFNLDFNIIEPTETTKENPYFGYGVFSPMYSMSEKFDGTEPVFILGTNNPKFIGGNNEMYKFLEQYLKYPKSARKNGIEGTVFIGIVIEKDGSVTNVHVKRGISEDCNAEAVRVIKLLNKKWTVGDYNGQPIRFAYTVPIKFKLE